MNIVVNNQSHDKPPIISPAWNEEKEVVMGGHVSPHNISKELLQGTMERERR